MYLLVYWTDASCCNNYWHFYYCNYLHLYDLCRVFGHFSHRSEWQLVKVDYKSIFDRRCAEEDYRPWQLHSQVQGREQRVDAEQKAWGVLGAS